MGSDWRLSTQPDSGPDTTSKGYEYQAGYRAILMDRGYGSQSSTESMTSGNSHTSSQDQIFTAPLSPISSYAGSPQSLSNEYTSLRITQSQAYLLPAQQKLEVEASSSCEGRADTELPPFDIEADGDPKIKWFMYYDFRVTKTEAFWELQPGYLVTAGYPSRVPSEKYETYAQS